MTPSAPPPAVAHAQIRQPAAHLDSFDAGAVAASGYSFSVGACTGGRPEEASEDVLLEAGLAGAAEYDLRLLEMEVREQLSFATDDELGVGEADEILDEEMRAIGSATSFGRKMREPAALSRFLRRRISVNKSRHAVQPRVSSRLPMRRTAISLVCSMRLSFSRSICSSIRRF